MRDWNKNNEETFDLTSTKDITGKVCLNLIAWIGNLLGSNKHDTGNFSRTFYFVPLLTEWIPHGLHKFVYNVAQSKGKAHFQKNTYSTDTSHDL